ncbi:MAG: RluA family pseudouridine synthase [Beijerinckiaceae bacterium]
MPDRASVYDEDAAAEGADTRRDERDARRPDRNSFRKPKFAARDKGPRAALAEDNAGLHERSVRKPRAERVIVAEPAADAITPEPVSTTVQIVEVTADEAGMRVDRFLESKFRGLSFAHIQRIVRKGELRVDGKRADSKDRLEAGQKVRIPPMKLEAPKRPSDEIRDKVLAELKAMTLWEDDDVLVLNKPYGLAVQGGSGTVKHIDGMLEALIDRDGQRPRLVHRIDKDTAGCLLVAKTRFAASAMTKSFRSRDTRKIYWALVSGVPRMRQGRISTYVAREDLPEGDSRMRIAKHGEEGASHALTYYAVVETSAQKLAWLSLKPVTGRTHQLRVHAAEIGHPIVGDPKYFNIENWEFPGGLQNRLHLLARRIVIPHPRGKGVIDVSAPLPPHMQQSWNLLGLDAKRYDPIEDAPER